MNNDEKSQEPQNPISAEMEARIVAWVSGEATAAESGELERLVAGNPVLGEFKGRIEAARKLAAEAVAPDKAPLRMSEVRRAALLREIGATERASVSESVAADVPVLVDIKRRHSRERRWMLAAAACVTTGLFLAMMIPSFQKVRHKGVAAESYRGAAYLENTVPVAEEEKEVDVAETEFQAKKSRMVALPDSRMGVAPRINIPVEMPVVPPVVRDGLTDAEFRQARSRAFGGLGDVNSPSPATPDISVPSSAPGSFADLSPARADSGGRDRIMAAPGERAAVESEAPIVLSPFVVDETEDRGSYRAESTLAGTRVRTDLKDVASAISVATAQFLQDTGANTGKNVLALSPKGESAALSGNFTTTTSPAAGSTNDEPTVLSPFLAADAPGEESTKVADGQPAAQAAADKLQAGPDGPAKISFVTSSIGTIVTGTGSPAGVPDSAKVDDSREPANGSFNEVSAAKEPVSTFSLHVSDVSFRLAQAALARGEVPDPAQIRPEEFYNAFDYGDPVPAMSEKIACHTEQSADPVMQQRNLLRIAMRVPATGHSAKQPLRLTVLLDTSGSMEREDRAAAASSAMKVLVSLLTRDDRVTLVGFARTPRLLGELVPGDKAGSLLDLIAKTPAEGGTNLEEAIKLGSELAQRQFTAGAQNRVVLLTDGAANLGDADPVHLAAQVESLRQRDIAFDACGIGAGGIDDSVLETLTRKGSGRYYVVDSPEAADAGFARQLAGAFRPAAENVKVQVRFNPARVGSYRLVGFENHRLNKEDFRNDKVAAAALAGGEAAVALYEVEALPQGDGDLGQVYVRFHDTASGRMVERSWALPYDPYVPAFDKATPTLQLAGTAALLAEKLRGGVRGEAIRLSELAPVMNTLRSHYSHEVPVQELAAMYQQMRRMRGE